MSRFLGGISLSFMCGAVLLLPATSTATPLNGSMSLQGDFTITPTQLLFCDTGVVTPCTGSSGSWNEPGSGTGGYATTAADPSAGTMIDLTYPIETVFAPTEFLEFAGGSPYNTEELFITEVLGGGGADCGNPFTNTASSCTPGGGGNNSAVLFQNNQGGSSATISIVGWAETCASTPCAAPNASNSSTLTGLLTANFDGETWQQVYAAFLASGSGVPANDSLTASFTGTFNSVAPVTTPEPMTLSMMGAGLVGLGLLRRKLVKK